MAESEKKAQRHKSCRGANPDFRHQPSLPAPAVADLERLLTTLPAPLAYQRWQQRQGLRERVLTLPALAAVVVAVWRGLGSVRTRPCARWRSQACSGNQPSASAARP